MDRSRIVAARHAPEKRERARQLRRGMTPAEAILWERLRAGRLHGRHFRRQQIIDGFIADFYCHAAGLVIEVDGDIHEMQIEYDKEREHVLTARGLRILRFTNDQITAQLPECLAAIATATTGEGPPTPPAPSLKGGGAEREAETGVRPPTPLTPSLKGGGAEREAEMGVRPPPPSPLPFREGVRGVGPLRNPSPLPFREGAGGVGNPDLLNLRLLALVCSRRCPGQLIVQAYDLAVALREAGVPVIGGFQTPMEAECLALLLRGSQPVIICPARSVAGMRIPQPWKAPLDAGRLLILSPFPEHERRQTSALAERRNQFVADIARAVLAVHAAPGGKTEQICRQARDAGKPLWTLPGDANANLLALGARPISPAEVARLAYPLPPP